MLSSWWSPHTDAGVIAQVIVTLVLGVVAAVLTRRERSVQLLVIGVMMVLLGWYGIRGLH